LGFHELENVKLSLQYLNDWPVVILVSSKNFGCEDIVSNSHFNLGMGAMAPVETIVNTVKNVLQISEQ
jgi:hypothetical protein